jgi:hypothetical protein
LRGPAAVPARGECSIHDLPEVRHCVLLLGPVWG